MAIKIEMLRCFATVVHHGSLNDAATALGRTPPAVSMMLKQFEENVGAPLFESSRKSRLTPLGLLIFEEARREVEHFDKSVSVIKGLANSEHGYLRLAVTPSIAATVLPPVIRSFCQSAPNVHIDLRDMDSAAIAIELERERADIGIGSFKPIDGMVAHQLFSDPFGVVCQKDHPLTKIQGPQKWQNLIGHDFIANGLCRLINDPDFAAILDRSKLMVPNTASLLGLVREGVGITVLPKLAVAHDPSNLAFLPLADTTVQRHVHAVSRNNAILMPAAHKFLELLQSMIASGSLKTST